MRSRIDVVQVELGSAMYKAGIRWTDYMESDSIGKHDEKYMVLGNILISHYYLHDHPYGFHDNYH